MEHVASILHASLSTLGQQYLTDALAHERAGDTPQALAYLEAASRILTLREGNTPTPSHDPLRDALTFLLQAIDHLADTWEEGDLAGAVTDPVSLADHTQTLLSEDT